MGAEQVGRAEDTRLRAGTCTAKLEVVAAFTVLGQAALPGWRCGPVPGTSPTVQPTGLWPEVPVAGRADQNLHDELSTGERTMTSVVLRSANELVRLHENPLQRGRHPLPARGLRCRKESLVKKEASTRVRMKSHSAVLED